MDEVDARRGYRLMTQGHHCSNRRIGSTRYRQKDRSKDSKKRFLRMKSGLRRRASDLLSNGQQDSSARQREDEKMSSGEIGTLGHLSVATKKGAHLKVLNNGDLESRFWTDGVSDGRVKATCSYSRGREMRRAASPSFLDRHVDLSSLPFDVLRNIAGSFSWPDLWAATRVCRAWCDALEPLRQGMLFVHWGKNYKHGKGVSRNLDKALDSFLKGAARGCAAAMVDAGLLLWEMGRREEGIQWYKQAAELGDSAGQCNLGLAFLQELSRPVEAVKWFHRAAVGGHVRAQYNLALCLQQGRGTEQDVMEAAHWYLRAAEGGSTRAMYNTALCFSGGDGLSRDSLQARRWMRRAALAGHRKAQYEHGVTLFEEGDRGLALVFLELATRAGETAGTHLRDTLLQQLSPWIRAHAITCADQWQRRHTRHG